MLGTRFWSFLRGPTELGNFLAVSAGHSYQQQMQGLVQPHLAIRSIDTLKSMWRNGMSNGSLTWKPNWDQSSSTEKSSPWLGQPFSTPPQSTHPQQPYMSHIWRKWAHNTEGRNWSLPSYEEGMSHYCGHALHSLGVPYGYVGVIYHNQRNLGPPHPSHALLIPNNPERVFIAGCKAWVS